MRSCRERFCQQMRTKALENAKVKAEFKQLADEFSLLDAL
jgi:hypothetical protein